jgi:flagellar biogenesis protein FliO
MTDLYFQMGIALAIVVGLIALLGVAMKKKQDKDSLMKMLGYQSLGPKKGIAAVRIGREVLLVGVTATDLKLLKSLDESQEEQGEPRPAQAAADKATVADISAKLQRLKAMKDMLYAVK